VITNLANPLVWNSVPTDLKKSLASTDLKDVGPTSPGPLGMGPVMSNPPRRGSAQSDPVSVGSVPPDPLERIPPRPTRGFWGRPRAGVRAPTRAPTVPNCYEHREWAQDHAPNTREEASASRRDRRPPQAIPRCYAAQSPCDSRQGNLLTIPHAREG
jgi:hypothetical protein